MMFWAYSLIYITFAYLTLQLIAKFIGEPLYYNWRNETIGELLMSTIFILFVGIIWPFSLLFLFLIFAVKYIRKFMNIKIKRILEWNPFEKKDNK